MFRSRPNLHTLAKLAAGDEQHEVSSHSFKQASMKTRTSRLIQDISRQDIKHLCTRTEKQSICLESQADLLKGKSLVESSKRKLAMSPCRISLFTSCGGGWSSVGPTQPLMCVIAVVPTFPETHSLPWRRIVAKNCGGKMGELPWQRGPDESRRICICLADCFKGLLHHFASISAASRFTCSHLLSAKIHLPELWAKMHRVSA